MPDEPVGRKRRKPEFKVEAVRVMQERLAAGVTLQRVSEELDVGPDLLREWAKQVGGAPPGTPADEVFPGHGQRRRFPSGPSSANPEAPPALEEEVRRLRRENARLRQERDFLKSGGVLREGVAVKYACIARHRDSLPVTRMCALLAVSPSGFYAAAARQRGPLGPRAQANARLVVAIRAEHAASRRRYGAPRIHRELCAQGLACGRHRVARLMRRDGLRGVCRQKFRVTTPSTPHAPIAANVVARQFAPAVIGARDRVWAADITYLGTGEGWLYLAVVLDLASRRIVGWCADRTLDHALALRALQQALVLRHPGPGLLHHSDRGVQYASAPYQALLATHGVVPSLSRPGNCWDNAVVESFFATLKTELAPMRWPTRAIARQDLTTFIDQWYNPHRRHSAIGYRSPIQYERELAHRRIA